MTRTAVLICPGRGSYNRAELGWLARYHADKAPLLAAFDAIRAREGAEGVTALDAAARFDGRKFLRGDVASPLIFACSLLDAFSLAPDIELVAVTGNSMGWYTALAAGGALAPEDGFRLADTMGRLMHARGTGGQLIYPFMDEDWRDDPARRAELLALVEDIASRKGHALALSIELGGMLVLAGNAAGLAAFEAAVPPLQGRFPMRLPGHAAFHSPLMAPVAEEGRRRLEAGMFGQPRLPLIDGRGAIWWPHATDTRALRDYTLGHQVTALYDFTRAVQVAAREFAPDLFILTGPGDSLGGAVAQALIRARWRGLSDRDGFRRMQEGPAPLLVAMGREDQRRQVAGPG